ncbi:MAG TPA: alpha/beta hydrolase domain-containing protein [Casimicrobiaceae bacterium]
MSRVGNWSVARKSKLLQLGVASALAGTFWATAPADARITQLTITSQTAAFGGASFGTVGTYQNLVGTAYGEVDPNDPLNAIITDIALAPRNANGMVEYSMDFSIFVPTDPSKGNHTLLYDVVNRGNMSIPALNIGSSGNNPGDGFLESQGYTLVFSGWEGDITTGIKINLPIAHNPDGSVITGRVRAEYILNSSPASTVDVTARPAYASVSTDNTGDTLTMRVHQDDPKVLIPNSDWAFADCTSTPFPGVPNPTKVCLSGNFDTNHIYELVYTAQNPTVAGIGFAATRDFISFLRNSNGAGKGNGNGNGNGNCKPGNSSSNGQGKGATCPPSGPSPTNPLGDSIQNAIIYGSSQSGRWIRTFIELGFNQDENHHQVVEGAIPHKASNRGAFNVRFAQPTRLSGTQHTEKQFPGAESSQTWNVSHDSISGITASQLDRCRTSGTCPKITATMTDTEYWQAYMALNTTDSFGGHDFPIPPEVRIYHFAGTMHGGGSPTALPGTVPSTPGNCQLPTNPNPFIPGQRALLVALQQWIVNGTEPPPSTYSTLAAGTLVPASSIVAPYVPAVGFTVAGLAAQKFYLDRGPAFNVADISGVMAEPPVPGGAYSLLVPKVDSDGNDVDGLRDVFMQVPLGTYTGWNPRKAGFSEGDSCDLTGGYIPFFRTQAQRNAVGDPRPSWAERYPTHQDYVDKVTAAANSLVAQRFLLPQDAALAIGQAQAASIP